jgi:solute carrier family 25 S-adenosylmethionine transporter 26
VKGGVARCFGQAILYPVDALRTLAQTRDAKTLADVGAKALARGCLTTSSFALAMGALQFGVFASLRRAGCNPLLSSAAGASASCLVSVPQEVIKQRLVTGIYPSFRTAVTSIFNDEGLKGFYSAWRPTVLRNVPFVIITFTTMEYFKNHLIRRHNSEKCSTGTVDARREHKEKLSIGENVAIGMASALVAGIATNPVDVVKTRMMTQAASSAVPYKSALECVSAMLRNESPAAFYAGFPQRSVYMCGLWGITFAVNGWLHSRREDEQ